MWRRYPGGRERFKPSAPLARVLRMHSKAEEPLTVIVAAVREYAVSRGLLAPEDRRSIQCDSQLRSIFGVDKLSFFHLEVSQPRAPRALLRAISTRARSLLTGTPDESSLATRPHRHRPHHLAAPADAERGHDRRPVTCCDG